MKTVQEYAESFSGIQREWLDILMDYMHRKYPDFQETLSYQMPMYKFNRQYIGFSLAKEHCSVHTLDFAVIDLAKTWLPKAKFGKGCVKVRYEDKDAIPALFKLIDLVVERSSTEADQV